MREDEAAAERDSWFLVLPVVEAPRRLWRSPGTLGVIIASLVVVALGEHWPGVTRALECTTGGIADGELWRLVTYVLPHEGGWPHVLVNMALLALYGWQLERRVGTTHFLIIYFGSGALGMAMLSGLYPIDAELGLRGGASLAVFGTVAALATWHAARGGLGNPATPWAVGTCLVLLIASGLINLADHEDVPTPAVGWFVFGFANHALGMIAGVELGIALEARYSTFARWTAATVAVLVAATGLTVGVVRWT